MKQSIPLIVGNWKMNPGTLEEAAALARALARKHRCDEPYLAVAPPFVHLTEVGKRIAKSTIALAAQDVSHQAVGPFTGEVSAGQLKDLGVSFVIIGHSERRALGESNELVRQKVLAALKHRLTPIVCIGERERDESGDFFSFIEEQLRDLTSVLSPQQMKKVIIAYEPIWAIGTGRTATPDNVKEMQLFIESVLTKLYDRATARKVRLLYGGSVKPHNAAELYTTGDMQGFLVGGASLRAEDLIAIRNAATSDA